MSTKTKIIAEKADRILIKLVCPSTWIMLILAFFWFFWSLIPFQPGTM